VLIVRDAIAVALVLALSTFAFAQSNPPIPSALESNKAPETHSRQQQNAAKSDERGTEQSPPVVKVLPAPNAQANTTTQPQPQKRESAHNWWPLWDWSPEWALVAITGLLCLITGLLALFTGWLWSATRRLVVDANDATRRQLRAYVWENYTAHPTETKDFTLLVNGSIRNTGLTPAYNVRAWSDMKFLTDAEFNTHAFAQPDSEQHPTTPFACNPRSKHWHATDLKDAGWIDIGISGKKLYLWGRIDYEDAFGISHWKTYRLYFRIESGHANWAYCKEGNEEDRPEPPAANRGRLWRRA
jgi:hypothetical protein